MCQTPKKRMELPNKSFHSQFYELLRLFLNEKSEIDRDFLPIPPMLGDGKSVDLLKLFLIVRENGGYETVSNNRLWPEVAKESGYDALGACLKLVYIKYLRALGTWLERLVEDKDAQAEVTPLSNTGLMQLSDEFKAFLSLVPNSKELECKLNLMVTEDMESNGNRSCVVEHNVMESSFAKGDVTHRDFTSVIVDWTESVRENGCKGRKSSNVNKRKPVRKFTSNGNNPSDNGSKSKDNGNKSKRVRKFTSSKGVRKFTSNGNNTSSNGSKNKDNGNKNKKVRKFTSIGNNHVNNPSNDLISNGSIQLISESKRKQLSMSQMVTWVTSVARNPCDPVIPPLPERPKWNAYANEELWKQVLFAREKLFSKRKGNPRAEQYDCQRKQKVDPSWYDDDEPVGLNYKLRERSKIKKKHFLGEVSASNFSVSQTKLGPSRKGIGKGGSSFKNPGIDIPSKAAVPRGIHFQVEVPEWTGVTSESNPKWMGTLIWPMEIEGKKLNVDTEETGKGRQDSCGCQVPNSLDCVRQHIKERNLKLKNELGIAYSHWKLDNTGEEVALSWTEDDRRKFETIVHSRKNFWGEIKKSFQTKKIEDLVNYLFNVVLLQKRGHQNRFTPEKVYTDSESDSDDDQAAKASGKCRATVIRSLYSPKKRRMK